jgi:hypothetical protein
MPAGREHMTMHRIISGFDPGGEPTIPLRSARNHINVVFWIPRLRGFMMLVAACMIGHDFADGRGYTQITF